MIAANGCKSGDGKGDRLFQTTDLTKQLKAVTARGISATGIAQVARFLLGLASVAILARLLEPADFGLVAMVAVFTGLLGALRDGGLSMATVQRESITHEQVSNLFWINCGLGACLTLVSAASAPLLARAYGQPELVAICLALSISFFVTSPAVQPDALMRRRMRFKELMAIDVAAQTAGIGAAIGIALAGFGYWALVSMPLVTALVQSAATVAICGWRPGPPRRGTGVRSLLRFGGYVLGGNAIQSLSSNTTPALIGYLAGPAALGLFTRAKTLADLPSGQVLVPIMIPAQSAFARIAGEPERFRRAALSLLRKTCAASMIMAVLLIVSADAVVRFFLGSGWDGAVPLFRLLAVFILVEPMATIVAILMIAVGRADKVLHWKLISFLIIVASALAGTHWGLFGIVAGFALSGLLVRMPLFLVYAARFIHLEAGAVWKACLPILLAAGAAGGLLHGLRVYVLDEQAIWSLPAGVLVVGLLYGAILFALPRTRSDFLEVAVIARHCARSVRRATGSAS
jgi:O-antigen/teichoic acid export membrane protein